MPHDCTDGFLGAYWRRPAAYLDPGVRSAMSTFAKIGDVTAGVERLRAELADGAWAERHADLLGRAELDLGYPAGRRGRPCRTVREGGGAMTEHITPAELKARLDRHEPVVLLDVRDGWEVALCRLEHAVHIPMEEIELRTEELDPAADIVVYCHHGVRSAAVAEYLRGLGFPKAVNLAGGIDEWARRVEPGMRRY